MAKAAEKDATKQKAGKVAAADHELIMEEALQRDKLEYDKSDSESESDDEDEDEPEHEATDDDE